MQHSMPRASKDKLRSKSKKKESASSVGLTSALMRAFTERLLASELALYLLSSTLPETASAGKENAS